MICRLLNPQSVDRSRRKLQRSRSHWGASATTWLIVALGLGVSAHAAEPTVVSLDQWSNVIAGEEIALRFHLPPNVASGKAVGWSVVIDAAIIARRETAVRSDKDRQPILTVKGLSSNKLSKCDRSIYRGSRTMRRCTTHKRSMDWN